jgi:hypothetical protein
LDARFTGTGIAPLNHVSLHRYRFSLTFVPIPVAILVPIHMLVPF